MATDQDQYETSDHLTSNRHKKYKVLDTGNDLETRNKTNKQGSHHKSNTSSKPTRPDARALSETRSTNLMPKNIMSDNDNEA